MTRRTADAGAVKQVLKRQGTPVTPGLDDIGAYLALQVADESHREVLGPLLVASGASGVVIHRGERIGAWGDPSIPEMLFSATKSVVSLVAGVAFDQGLLHPTQPVVESIDIPLLASGSDRRITWEQLLQQTSMWEGELWGKPTRVDAQSSREGDEAAAGAPGSGWAYNDVRVNLVCLALTQLLRQPLPDVLRTHVMEPLGASRSWSWHGYDHSTVRVEGAHLPVVSGGAHWGGGLFMSAADLALIGQLYLDDGGCPLSGEWIQRSWVPCGIRASYGYLWWLNDSAAVMTAAPTSGRCARGNGGRHLLWVDPARDLVLASHWTENTETLIAEVSRVLLPN